MWNAILFLAGFLIGYLAFGPLSAHAAAEDTGCALIARWGWSLIDDHAHYLPAPRPGDPAKNETMPYVWAEGHLVTSGDPASPLGAYSRFVPDRYTIVAVLRAMHATAAGTPSEAAAGEAYDAVLDAVDQVVGPRDPLAPISHDEAAAAFDRAVELCQVRGVATLPRVDAGP